MSPEMVREDFGRWTADPGTDAKAAAERPPLEEPPGWSARKTFVDLNEALLSEKRFKLLGHVHEPVEADFYMAPPGIEAET